LSGGLKPLARITISNAARNALLILFKGYIQPMIFRNSMMTGFNAIRTLFAAGIIATASAGALAAQQVITLDNDVCTRGLKALGGTLQAEIKTSTSARKIAGTCRAQNVRLTAGDVVLEFGNIQWPSGTLIALESGEIPETLTLSITRARVIKSPAEDAFWAFLKAQGAGGKRMDATFGFRYKAEDKELIVQQANIDFQNGNSISLRARIGGINADIPENPVVAAAVYIIKRVELRLTSGRTSANPVLAALRDAVEKDMQEKELGGRDFKRNLKTLATEELGPVLDSADMGDLRRLINDAPRAKDDIKLQVNSADGFVLAQLARLALMEPQDRLAAVMDDFEVKFAYGPRAH
jgi:hypothetical protein